jgi:dihydrofolate synthase / folylpolyglutamate synthase
MSRPDPVLNRLKSLHPTVIDLSLERLARLLADLGHPERRLPPTIHVAGTNGKGSTVAFLRAMLEADGKRVHTYTSPHLVRFNERIRLAGELIGDDALTAYLEEVERVNDGRPITYFEVTTAAAFLAYARIPADALLLEVGLGGRFDATNVIDRPAATAISRISYDHRQFLGDSIEGIAAEKAGILKPGVRAVFAPQPVASVTRVFEEQSRAVGARPVRWSVERTPGGFRFDSEDRALDLPPPGLLGAHQYTNAGLALAAIGGLPYRLPGEALRRGIAAVEWPGRLQRLTRGPLAARLPQGWELWLDGGHNDSAGEVLAAQADAWSADGRPLLAVYGMLTTKRPDEFLAPLAPYVKGLRAVHIPGEEASLGADEAAAAARAAGIADSAAADDVATAIGALVARQNGPARILICGSLYLAGSVLAENG